MAKAYSLPPELAEIESHLRDLPVSSACLDRDETLYRAGWAAAVVQIHRGASGHGWFWPATSAMLAASVLILSLFLVDGDGTRATMVAHEKPLPSGEGLGRSETVEVESAPAESHLPLAFARRFSPDDQSLLAVRDRALRGLFTVRPHTASLDDCTIREAKTNRELLNEMLKGNTNS